MKVRFYDLLGVADPDEAAERWPRDLVRPFVGLPRGDLDDLYRDLMIHLQDALELRGVRPGAEADRVGLWAELYVRKPPIGLPLVMAAISELEFRLEDTDDLPAIMFVTHGSTGLEVMIQGLPVEIRFPPGMIQPIYEDAEIDAAVGDLPDKPLTVGSFVPNHADSVEIVASDNDATRIKVRVNVRLTTEGEFLFDTVVPLSIGPCKLSGLPSRGLHDIQIIPTPTPQHVDRWHRGPEMALEWIRHDISIDVPHDASTPGLITIRTIDLDADREPLRTIAEKMHADRPEADPIEFVLEDVAIPFRTAPPLPIPTHARFSLRRRVSAGDSAQELYDFGSAPADLVIGGTHFKIFRFLLQTTDFEDELPVAVDVKWTPDQGDDVDPVIGFEMKFDENGEVLLGATIPGAVSFVRILGAHVRLGALRFGVSLRKLFDGADDSTLDMLALLGDFLLLTGEQEETFEIRDSTGTPTTKIFHDVGWKFGKPAFGSLYNPDGVQYVALGAFEFVVEELGLVTEHNGGLYLVLSARLESDFGADEEPRPDPNAEPEPFVAGSDDAKRYGVGIRLHRLRRRISGGPGLPDWLIDGVSLFLRKGTFELTGFGMIADRQGPDGNRYRENAVELKVRFRLRGRDFELGGQYLEGNVTGTEQFEYLMVALSLGRLPIGPIELSQVRALYANNMAPRLDPPDGHAQPMRLFRWYKQHGDALSLPLDRKLQAWAPVENAGALGIGTSIHLAATKAVRLDTFLFAHGSPGEGGLLTGVELYFGEAEKPIAYGAVDWDIAQDKWGILLGVSLGLENVLGRNLPSLLRDLAALTGTFFYGNKPDTIALGQYNDPSTWLSLKFQFKNKIELAMAAAYCRHRVDEEDALDPTTERINVHAIAASIKGGGSLGPLGSLKVYASFSVVWGQWRTEGLATGHQFTFEAGIRCKVFGCFNFGAHIKVDTASLGPAEQPYQRKSTIFRIETPWYLPDLTYRWERTSGTPVPEAMQMLAVPVGGATALPVSGAKQTAQIGLTSLVGDTGSGPIRELRQLRTAMPAPASDADFASRSPVTVDSAIALDFAAAVDASATVVPSTAGTAGSAQASNDLRVTYELVEIGIRRRRRFPPDAGVWRDLIDPLETRLDGLGGLTPEEIEARFHSEVGFDWDPGMHRLGKVDTRRLLINAITPFTFTTRDPETDEVLAATQPGWPCCHPSRPKPRWHVVHFADTPVGVRTPAVESFTQSSSTLHWVGGRPPVVVPALVAPQGTQVASVLIEAAREGTLAVASFDEPAAVCEAFAYWAPAHSNALLVVEAYAGLDLVAQQIFSMSSPAPVGPIRVTSPTGVTSMTFRMVGRVALASSQRDAVVELLQVRYRSVRDERHDQTEPYRCDAQDDHGHGGGRLAWLPNSDYEINVKTRIVLDHVRSGVQELELAQRSYFRTKGLPGLNAVARIGEEIEPYVESRYPDPGGYLYRTEPLVVAFNEKFNVLVPVDRTISEDDAEERQQLVEWVLAVDLVRGEELEPVSLTAADWVVAHRPPSPLPRRRPVVLSPEVFTSPVRTAPTLDLARVRLERMMTRPGGCTTTAPLHASQVLVHQPHDPARPGATVRRWPADAELRANLRWKEGPFVARTRFDDADAGAFGFHADAGVAAPWVSTGGSMRPTLLTEDGLYATFGDAGWDHVQIRTRVDPAGARAGVALAVSGAPFVDRAIEIVIDARGSVPALRIVARDGGATLELASHDLPEGSAAPYLLEVTGFDDRIRARVGDVVVEPDQERGALRGGHVALLSRGGGSFASLEVQALDAYQLGFRSSRYDDFAAHVASFEDRLTVIEVGAAGPPRASVAELFAQDAAAIAEAMTPAGRPEARDRLFRRWIEALALPLAEAPERSSVSRLVTAEATQLLVIESPEPLPFSRDVTLELQRRQLSTPPWDPSWPVSPEVVAALYELLLDVDLTAEDVLLPPLPEALGPVARIVVTRAPETAVEETRYRVAPRARGRLARPGTRLVRDTPASPPARRELRELTVFDRFDRPLLPPLPLPPSVPQFVTLPTIALSDGDERRALVIPVDATRTHVVALAGGTHRLRFALDRVRFRAAAPDATSNYRASAMIPLVW